MAERKLKTRDVNEKAVRKLFDTTIKGIYENYEENKLTRLLSAQRTIDGKYELLKKLEEDILEIVAVEHLEEINERSMEFDLYFNEQSIILSEFIKLKKVKEDNISVTSSTGSLNVKLPKIEIKKFRGDPTTWRNFIDSFECAVDKNDRLSEVEKMNYLINLVSGEAENCINGLSLCNENYTIALDLLKERYADKQVLISSHMNKLLEIKTVKEISNTVGLRALYDHVNAQVRSLLSIGLNTDDYGPMLIPVLMSKTPQELKLLITRQFGKDVWNINNILKSLKDEIETREKLNLTTAPEEDQGRFPLFSGANLFTSSDQNNQKRNDWPDQNNQERNDWPKKNNQKRNDWQKNKLFCVFCEGEHKSQKCANITKLETRKVILKKVAVVFYV